MKVILEVPRKGRSCKVQEKETQLAIRKKKCTMRMFKHRSRSWCSHHLHARSPNPDLTLMSALLSISWTRNTSAILSFCGMG